MSQCHEVPRVQPDAHPEHCDRFRPDADVARAGVYQHGLRHDAAEPCHRVLPQRLPRNLPLILSR